ncbi:type II pantothenate kinase [Rhizoctonia solani AG-1 IB]|uniref:pantothenate kinase n=1 Tax=Thanatephorus cucumeris (strain AG1-IB / isolate 7/3/14) TaxID=1108050 RepID=M5BXA0_THACB|nr:type II pantothenate kinase [Rhizoctonia solani AG-1 IB]
MPEVPIPSAQVIQVDTRGALILGEDSPATRDSRGIYLPNHIEPVSHIAVDIGGSLAKVVYFTRSASSPQAKAESPSTPGFFDKVDGALTPLALDTSPVTDMTSVNNLLQRRAAVNHFPGGSLNFERFETESIDDCTDFICQLIDRSARINRVNIAEMRRSVKIMATGGGAYRYCDLLRTRTGVDVTLEAEMDCLITGLNFITLIPNEVYYFSDELIRSVRAPQPTATFLPASPSNEPLERPSPNPPEYQVAFAAPPTVSNPHLPCLVVNIGSGVSILRVDASGQFERVSGSALGGGTLWGLLSLLTGATSFDEMLALSERGDHSKVDMLVGDIYGNESGGTDKLGLKANVIASSFGKVFKKGKGAERGNFAPEDISRSLLYAISNNIGHIAYMNAEKYGLKRIYFGGCFIRGHATTIATLSYAIRFWSKGSMRAMFLRHEGFLYVLYLFLLLILVEHISHFQRIDWSMDQEYRPEQHYVPLFTNRLLIANHI